MNANVPTRILVVDDDAAVCDVVGEYLGNNGMRVSVGGSAREMFEVIDREAVDLILLDLKLPDEDGIELVRVLRERATVPLILVTGCREEADRVMGLELGADDYVTKPFSVKVLLQRIRALQRRSDTVHESGDTIEHLPEAFPFLPPRRANA